MASPSKPTAGDNLRFYHFGNLNRRKGKYGYYKEANVILKRHPRQVTVIRMSDMFEEFTQGFKMGTHMTRADDGSYKFTPRTKILTCPRFDFDEEMLHEFCNPTLVNLDKLPTLSIGSRVSVQGIVEGVSEHSSVSLKTVTLKQDDSTIQLKLWGELSKTEVTINDVISVKCCTLREYKGKVDLNSTTDTKIVAVPQLTETVTGYIEAIGFDDETPMVILDDKLFLSSRAVIDKMFPEKEIPSGMFSLTVKGNIVMSMSPVGEMELSESE